MPIFRVRKKNQLSKTLQKQNDQLADRYNSKGSFPFTAILDANGKILKSWDGFPKETPEVFLQEIKDLFETNP